MARMVLVHGATGGAWQWEPLLPGLRAAGHEVEALDLPRDADVSLDACANRVCEVLAAGAPAVLVGHSMGGMVVTQAAARTPWQVIALIYTCAFVPNDGESLLDLTHYPEAAGDMIQANLVVTGEPPMSSLSDAAAREAIYNCCTDEQAAWALPRLRPQPVAIMAQPFELQPSTAEAFRALPRRYVTTLQDRCIRPPLQRLMLERAGCDPVVVLDTDHAPYLSRTDEFVAALDRLASASSQSSVGAHDG
jgi:pimeloyl-ACP methyl ester carboxylesterase